MLFLRYESCSLWKTLLWLWNVINLCLSVKWDSISWWFFLFTSMSILTNYCIIFWLYHFINRESLSPWNYFNLATYYWNAYIKPGEWAGMNAYMYVYTGNRLCLFSFFIRFSDWMLQLFWRCDIFFFCFSILSTVIIKDISFEDGYYFQPIIGQYLIMINNIRGASLSKKNMDQIETILRLLQIKLQEYTKTAKIQLRAIFHIDLKNLTSTCRFNNISSCYKIL